MVIWGVAAALVGAVMLALGAQFQGRGVRSFEREEERFGLHRLLRLFTSGGWLLGSGFLALAVLLQLVALLLAPLPVVQPVGVLSLVVTALLNRRLAHARLPRTGIIGVALALVGTAAFVATASVATTSPPQPPQRVVPVLVLVGVVLLVLLVGYALLRNRVPTVAFAVAGGICFGFVVTLMKVVLDRCSTAVQHGNLFDATAPFTALVGAGAALAGIAGISLVQRAYASGSADIVVAALTVVDPLVAASLGIALLAQARNAPLWSFAVFGLAEAVAVTGVALMATHPPVPEAEAVPTRPDPAAARP